ncbi:OB-fold nucleic acid binding domain [Macleaya cordata]|uniref:CST complex subunit STN1 n=1 Tax=Macleaya cordata TaxID=56857 RepID=A0A200PPF0_MACCD|nr:OB-fold nucleic acid binding domain [Macleaya cordata]
MDPMKGSHVKLLAFDFLSLTQNASSSSSSSSSSASGAVFLYKKCRPVSRAETLGVVVSREFKANKFLKFLIDDGTGCVPCILWLNHLNSPYFSRRNPFNVRVLAEKANDHASQIQIGVLARIRGRVTAYRGTLQITVTDVLLERDPNAEILHWLDCIRLARNCYDRSINLPNLQKQQRRF